MIKIFKTFGGYNEIPKFEKNCWINVTAPIPGRNQTAYDMNLNYRRMLFRIFWILTNGRVLNSTMTGH